MSFSPPPPPLPGRNRYRNCALYSWLSCVISASVYANISLLRERNVLDVPPMVTVSLLTALALTGVVSGIVALCGVRKHGSQGIRAPAITGICLWVFSFGQIMSGA